MLPYALHTVHEAVWVILLDLSWIYDESLKPAHLPEGAARGAAIKEAAE